MKIILKYIMMMVALLLGDYFLSGIKIVGTEELYNAIRELNINNIFIFENWKSLLFVALLLFVIQFIIMPVLRLITFPINFITFGAFYFVLIIGSVKFLSYITDKFIVEGWWSLIIFAIILSAFVAMVKSSDKD